MFSWFLQVLSVSGTSVGCSPTLFHEGCSCGRPVQLPHVIPSTLPLTQHSPEPSLALAFLQETWAENRGNEGNDWCAPIWLHCSYSASILYQPLKGEGKAVCTPNRRRVQLIHLSDQQRDEFVLSTAGSLNFAHLFQQWLPQAPYDRVISDRGSHEVYTAQKRQQIQCPHFWAFGSQSQPTFPKPWTSPHLSSDPLSTFTSRFTGCCSFRGSPQQAFQKRTFPVGRFPRALPGPRGGPRWEPWRRPGCPRSRSARGGGAWAAPRSAARTSQTGWTGATPGAGGTAQANWDRERERTAGKLLRTWFLKALIPPFSQCPTWNI